MFYSVIFSVPIVDIFSVPIFLQILVYIFGVLVMIRPSEINVCYSQIFQALQF